MPPKIKRPLTLGEILGGVALFAANNYIENNLKQVFDDKKMKKRKSKKRYSKPEHKRKTRKPGERMVKTNGKDIELGGLHEWQR